MFQLINNLFNKLNRDADICEDFDGKDHHS